MHAIILSIGDELVLGQTVDTNSAWLSAQLARRGVGTLYHQTVADDQPAIRQAIVDASNRAELVLVTGGLGPTDDDLTRQALAQAMHVPLVLDAGSEKVIAEYFAIRGREMPKRNRVQAMHPVGSAMIPNTCGTAPGIEVKLNQATFFVMPGVPREMRAMFERTVEPRLHRFLGDRQVILTTSLHTFGIGESSLADLLDDLMARDRNPKVGTTVSNGLVSARIRSEYPTAHQASEQLERTVQEARRRVGAMVFGRDNQTLQASLLSLLIERKLTLATVESCTAGLLGSLLTHPPGASAAYAGGWITYSNPAKVQLGVPPDLLSTHGAVSGQVAKAMAQAGRDQSGADMAVSITGIAGPGGGSPDKPVGTVWIGLANGQEPTAAWQFRLSGLRETIRDQAAKCAMQLVRLRLLSQNIDRWEWVMAKA